MTFSLQILKQNKEGYLNGCDIHETVCSAVFDNVVVSLFGLVCWEREGLCRMTTTIRTKHTECGEKRDLKCKRGELKPFGKDGGYWWSILPAEPDGVNILPEAVFRDYARRHNKMFDRVKDR